MKKHFLIFIFLFAVNAFFVQNLLAKGQSRFNAGVGFSSYGVPVYFGFDCGIQKDLTLGGEISYRSYSENWRSDCYNHSVIGFSGNTNYHFNSLLQIPKRWDFYAGLNIGFYLWNSSDSYNGSHSSGLGLGAQVGGRYYFTDGIAFNVEFGGGNAFSGGKFGLSINL